jgi:PKD repeat protein
MKLAMVSTMAAAGALISSTLAMADVGSTPLEALFEQERVEISNAVRVYFPSRALADKASISFHHQLLASHRDQGYLIMQLDADDKAKLKSFGFTFAPATQWIAGRNQQISDLKEAAVKRSNQVNRLANDSIEGFSCYSTVESTYSKAQMLANSYPELANWVDIGDSWTKTTGDGSSGYDIKVLQMTNSATVGDKPILFIHSAMHAREYATAELTLRFAQHLLNNYDNNADAGWILDNHQVHIVFQMNPDGRKMAETGLLWRKNVNGEYCGIASNSRGADLNRNFSMFWNDTLGVGSSSDECSDTFRGEGPASEPETQAIESYIRSIFADRRGPNDSDAAPDDTTGMHLDIHSFSRLMLWPWGHTDIPAPNAVALQTLGRKMAYFNGYTPMQSIGLYPTDGTSDDVSYGELGIAAYTFELGTNFFQDCGTFDNTILPDNLKALIYAAKVVRAPYKLPAGPDATDITLNGLTRLNVNAGATITLQTTISDERYQNTNGQEPSQAIVEAEYYVDQTPWQAGAQAHAMQASDGTMDSTSELMQAQINTSGMANGKYRVYVRGKDADDNWGPVSAVYLSIGQENASPTAVYASQCTGVSCTFDASGSTDSDGTILNYRWDISDGTTIGSTEATVNHVFAEEGSYVVNLTVIDDLGASDTVEVNETVINLAPTADFSISCANGSCNFDASGSGDLDGTVTSYEWSFGGTATGNGANTAHTFTVSGTFDVTLTVTDNLGATHSKTVSVDITVLVQPEPGSSSGGGGSFGLVGFILLGGGIVRRRIVVNTITRRFLNITVRNRRTIYLWRCKSEISQRKRYDRLEKQNN